MYKARQSLALYIRKEGKSLLSLLGEVDLIVVQHLSQHDIQIAEVVVAGLKSVHLSLRKVPLGVVDADRFTIFQHGDESAQVVGQLH